MGRSSSSGIQDTDPGRIELGHFSLNSLGHASFELKLQRAARGSRRTSAALCEQLKAAIDDGRLAPGTRLPATREAPAAFGASRNTVAQVYETLLADGYVSTRRGAGTFVRIDAARTAPARNLAAPSPEADRRLNAFWQREDVRSAIGFWRDDPPSADAAANAEAIDFRPALVDSRLFPFAVYRRISNQQLRRLERAPPTLTSPQGHPGSYRLRAALQRHLSSTRAMACRPEDMLVTSGAQQAFDLLARALVTPGVTVVAVEEPGYPPLRVAFAAAGARVVPVEVDNEGLVVDRLPADCHVVCVTPCHQFPTGVAMSPDRRRALLDFAKARNAVVIEDDYDGEFRFEGGPLTALKTLDTEDRVFYVGTLSKCMVPALRLGYIVAPAWALATLIRVKNACDWHCSVPLQASVAAFIAEGHLIQHVRRMREVYRERRLALQGALSSVLADWLEPAPSAYGMHLCAWARGPLDLESTTRRLAGRHVRIHSLERYRMVPGARPGLVFGYGAVDQASITRGAELLRQVLSGR